MDTVNLNKCPLNATDGNSESWWMLFKCNMRQTGTKKADNIIAYMYKEIPNGV